MENSPFDSLEQFASQKNSGELLNNLIQTIRDSGDYHKLFDALMLKKKYELGLPLSRPSSLQDVPEEHRKEVEAAYIEAAREVGESLVDQGDLSGAWMYLQVIREPQKLAAAIEELPENIDDYEKMDEILQLALYQGVNPAKGVKIMINGHGTCSTITALDQSLPQMSQENRTACAKIMVRSLYQDLLDAVRRHVEQKVPLLEPDQSLQQLITGRDWLFENGNYHVDVSHLNSVVRFARSIEGPAEELELARQMALYGSKLERSLQYEGEPPFEDFFPAHLHFFNILLNKNLEESLQYFRDKLEAEPDEQDKPLLAYVLVDLLIRSDQLDEAVDLSARYLSNLNEEVSISFDELCLKAGKVDMLKSVRKEQDDLVGFAAALLRE